MKRIRVMTVFAVLALAVSIPTLSMAQKSIVHEPTAFLQKATPPLQADLSCNGDSTDVTYSFYRTTTTATSSSGCPTALSAYTAVGMCQGQILCSCADTGITQPASYCYVATADNSILQQSGPSAPLFVSVPASPNPPTNLQVTSIVAGRVNLQWQAPAEKVADYRVLRKKLTASSYKTVMWGLKTTSASDTPGAGTFNYEAVAVYGGELSAPSNVATAVVP